jgi:hypothetical protein
MPYRIFLEYTVVGPPVRPYTVYGAERPKTPHTVYRIFCRTSTLMWSGRYWYSIAIRNGQKKFWILRWKTFFPKVGLAFAFPFHFQIQKLVATYFMVSCVVRAFGFGRTPPPCKVIYVVVCKSYLTYAT